MESFVDIVHPVKLGTSQIRFQEVNEHLQVALMAGNQKLGHEKQKLPIVIRRVQILCFPSKALEHTAHITGRDTIDNFFHVIRNRHKARGANFNISGRRRQRQAVCEGCGLTKKPTRNILDSRAVNGLLPIRWV